jgi:hypothetical protein
MSLLELYKQRYKMWKADTGSVEWHTAASKVRAYNGDTFGALIHDFMASFKQLLNGLAEVADAWLESRRQLMNSS